MGIGTGLGSFEKPRPVTTPPHPIDPRDTA